MAARAWMLGAYIFVENPGRTANEDLNLSVGGTIRVNVDAIKPLDKQLFTITIKIYDSDTFFDDFLVTNNSFQLGVHDTDFHCFHTSVIVPHKVLNDCEGPGEDTAELYARVFAQAGTIKTNVSQSEEEDVKIFP